MLVGTRVLVSFTNSKYLGIVVNMDSKCLVMLDDGREKTVSTNKLTPIVYFNKVTNAVNTKWLTENKNYIKDADFNTHTYFLRKSPVIVSITLLKCMWYWANKYVFKESLVLPILKTKTKKRTQAGSYYYIPGPPDKDIIGVNIGGNNTLFECFSTLLHEMVHQYNYRIDFLEKRTFDPNSGGHGKTFFAWRGPLAQIARVPLTLNHDASQISVDDADKSSESVVKAKNPMFVLISSKDGRLFASKGLTKTDLIPLFNFIRARFKSESKIYQIDNLGLLNGITSVKSKTVPSAQKTEFGYISIISPSVAEAVKSSHIKD